MHSARHQTSSRALTREDTDYDRARGIVGVLRYCEQEVSYESVAKQFYHETHRTLSRDDYERASKRGE